MEAVKILGVAEIARARGGTLAEAAFEYAAERAAFLGGQFGAFRWRCPDCGGLVSDRGPLGNHPAADDPTCDTISACVILRVADLRFYGLW